MVEIPGGPASSVTGNATDDGTTVKGAPGHTVHASLIRASSLDERFIRMKTLLP